MTPLIVWGLFPRLLGLVYLGYLYEYKWKFSHLKVFRYFNAAYAALLVYSLVELINPSLPDITVGLIGLKTLLYYIPRREDPFPTSRSNPRRWLRLQPVTNVPT